MKRTFVLIGLLTVATLLRPSDVAGQARGKQPRRAAPAGAPASRGGPLTLPDVIECLNTVTFGPAYCEKSVVTRGVNFRADSVSILEILKEFGATQATLDAVPRSPAPPKPKLSGPLTIRCEPVDCLVVVNDKFYGPTKEGRMTVESLAAGETVVQIFREGYEPQTQKLELVENKPADSKLQLKLIGEINTWMVKDSLLETIRAMGGIDGISALGEVQGEGTMDWIDSEGQTQHWPMTFTKRSGKDVTLGFKTRDGQCSASILGANRNRECKGKLKNVGENTADQAATLFLSYQIQAVLNDLLAHVGDISSADNGKRLEMSDKLDSYVLTVGDDKLPTRLVYTRADKPDGTVIVKYSDYKPAGSGRYPAQIAIDSAKGTAGFTFKFTTIRSNAARL